MKKIALIAVLAAFVAAPALAEVQAVKLSGSINVIGLQRNDFDFGDSTGIDLDQNIFITQTMLDVNADLTDQVSATIGLINERVWGEVSGASSAEGVDLYLAYITLREFLYSPLTVVAGKQSFRYGNSFIVDSAGTNTSAPLSSGLDGIAEDLTAQTTQDAVRLIFDYNPLVLELLWSKIDEENGDVADSSNVNDDDTDLFGVNVAYNFEDENNTSIEAYVFTKIDREDPQTPSLQEDDTIYVPGIRVSTNIVDALNAQVEIAHQGGDDAVSSSSTLDRDAWGFLGILTWAIPGEDVGMEGMNPTLQYIYNFTTGDGDSTDGDNEAWDPFYENLGGGTIYSSLFNLTNSHIHIVSFSASPMEDVMAKVSWTGLWLDEELPTTSALSTAAGTFNQPNTSSVTLANSTTENELGHEIDVDVSYAYTEDVKIGASLGWFFTGDVLAESNDDTASQALVNAKVTF